MSVQFTLNYASQIRNLTSQKVTKTCLLNLKVMNVSTFLKLASSVCYGRQQIRLSAIVYIGRHCAFQKKYSFNAFLQKHFKFKKPKFKLLIFNAKNLHTFS